MARRFVARHPVRLVNRTVRACVPWRQAALISAFAACVVIVGACGDDGGAGDARTDAATADDGDDGSSALGWETVELHASGEGYVSERVTYRSGPLAIVGQVCRPTAPGRFPLIVVNHGGVDGITAEEWNGDTCRAAAAGYVIAWSSYRGEEGSDGAIELCAGEVDDVLALLAVARAQSYVDPMRAAMYGVSHGGCITLQVLARGADLRSAVAFMGPTDWSTLLAYWEAHLDAGTGNTVAYEALVPLLRAVTGGSPAEVPAAYAARSPVAFASAIAASNVPLLIVQGIDDDVVPPSQACAFVDAHGGFVARHFDAVQALTTAPVVDCEGLAFSVADPAPGWAGPRHLELYDAAGHHFAGPAGALMATRGLEFLLAYL